MSAWNCNRCTFSNNSSSSSCLMCNALKSNTQHPQFLQKFINNNGSLNHQQFLQEKEILLKKTMDTGIVVLQSLKNSYSTKINDIKHKQNTSMNENVNNDTIRRKRKLSDASDESDRYNNDLPKTKKRKLLQKEYKNNNNNALDEFSSDDDDMINNTNTNTNTNINIQSSECEGDYHMNNNTNTNAQTNHTSVEIECIDEVDSELTQSENEDFVVNNNGNINSDDQKLNIIDKNTMTDTNSESSSDSSSFYSSSSENDGGNSTTDDPENDFDMDNWNTGICN
eukprot:265293_1